MYWFLMVLPLLAAASLLIMIGLLVYLFFSGVSLFVKVAISLIVWLLFMRFLLAVFGLFSDFSLDVWIWRFIGLLAVLIALKSLGLLRQLSLRTVLFVVSVVGGLFLAVLVLRYVRSIDVDDFSFVSWRDGIFPDSDVDPDSGGVDDGDVVLPVDDAVPVPPIPPVKPGRGCVLPWGGSIVDGHYVYAFEVRSDGVCDAQLRSCSDGFLSGSYTLRSCPSSHDYDVVHRDDYVFKNTPLYDSAPGSYSEGGGTQSILDDIANSLGGVDSGMVDLLPGIGGSQWYDLQGHRIGVADVGVGVPGVVVEDPLPIWDDFSPPLYDCQTPRGAMVSTGDSIRAYRHWEGYGSRPCEVELRYCYNGVLLGDFVYPECVQRSVTSG